ncbi:MAG: hypothetical protein EPN89_14955 [Methylovulum sp.]|nr:MAG: hypothetical protein EPN89_14955 [Methylovulum sp.]
MSTWNYRVIRKQHETGESVSFQIHEVYYDESGAIKGWTEKPVQPSGESIGELREDIGYFLTAFRKDVLERYEVNDKELLRPAYEDQEINEGHYFELMDRTSVALNYLIESVGNHPVVRKNAALRSTFEQAETALAELYQLAAKLEFEHVGG